MGKEVAKIVALVFAGFVIGILMGLTYHAYTTKGDAEAEAMSHTHVADSLTTLAATWKARADTAEAQAQALMAIADSLAEQDTVTLEWYLHERKLLPSADALAVKRILLWRNVRAN